SSARFKTDVMHLLPGDATLFGLRPVAFRYRAPWGDPAGMHLGLIAEEVARVAPEAVAFDADGRPEGVFYPLVVDRVVDEVGVRAGAALRAALERLADGL
ncbi:MAG TPA: tail fiber domain-containing protein, partial [Gemmatimonadota bacterium]|nr:tail fiber domain-containing protein [Gemmatimonadota bacterium]